MAHSPIGMWLKSASAPTVVAFEHGRLSGASQGPELLAALQDASGFELEARHFAQGAVKLEDFSGLHDLEALTDDSEGSVVVRAAQNQLLGKTVQGLAERKVSDAQAEAFLAKVSFPATTSKDRHVQTSLNRPGF